MRIATRARDEALNNPLFTSQDQRIEQKKLRVHGWYFDIGSGELLRLDGMGEDIKEISL